MRGFVVVFGYFRFFLACLVLISHIGITFQGFNPGVTAVVSFYMLAGFVVSNLLSKVFSHKKPFYFRFYYERVLRIFPQYLFVMFLTIIFIVVTGYGSPKFDLLKIVNNILIVPLNYYMFFDNSILQEPKWWLIPPAWSLGTELQAYLILPFIIYFKPIKVVTAVLSLFIFIVASVGFIHTDHFGYRLIPGVLFIFILGVSIHKQTSDSERVDLFDIYFPAFVYGILIILLTILGIFGSILSPYIRETTLGILIGLPIIIYLAKTEVKVPMNHLFGDISYGMFLSHFLAIWIVEYCSLIDKSRHLYLYTLYIFIIALSISIVGVLIVERRVKKYRFRLSKSIKKR